jgi:hypothetical protein
VFAQPGYALHDGQAVDVAGMASRKLSLTCHYSVELPGIEPGAKSHLTCEDVWIRYVEARETTPNDLRRRERC